MVKACYQLAKPGIVYGNTFTTIAAFLFACRWQFTFPIAVLMLATVVGIALVIASACVLNNYLDRDMDRKMERTNNRALVTGVISNPHALVFGTVLGLIGFGLLCTYVNVLTAGVALFGYVSYVVIYGAAKRITHWAGLIGSVPGAVSIVVGYTAVTGKLDVIALLLFLILVAWQMPHFYAIALYRLEEYKNADVPVFPAMRGIRETKMHIIAFALLYVLATASLFWSGRVGYVYLVSVLAFGLSWLWRSSKGFKATNDALWAKKLFLFSLIVLVSFCITLGFSPLLP